MLDGDGQQYHQYPAQQRKYRYPQPPWNGRIVDGIGGTTARGPAWKACGNLDAELAYLLPEIHKRTIYGGGAADIAGFDDMGPDDLAALAERTTSSNVACGEP